MNTNNPLAAMNALGESLTAENAGLCAKVKSFPSGSAMLDVNHDGRAWVMAYAPSHGFGVDQLHIGEGFTTCFRFVSDDFETAAKRLRELTFAEPGFRTTAMSLFVLQSKNIDRSREFYSLLGLNFAEEQHGNGPRHFAAILNGMVFEIYPCRDDVSAAPLRVGFHVESLDSVLETLRSHGTRIIREPLDSPWGRRAVVEDPDGNRVEISIRLPG